MSQLRKVPSSGFPFGVFEDPRNPLILIDQGIPTLEEPINIEYSKIIDDKRGFLLRFKESETPCRLLFTWQGKASSDVFEITKDNLPKLLDY